MTLYARSDIQTVAVSPDLGCGRNHRRPIVASGPREGLPALIWALDCLPCEAALNDDALWTPHKHKIPMTDEEKEHQDELAARGNAMMAQMADSLGSHAAEMVAKQQLADATAADQGGPEEDVIEVDRAPSVPEADEDDEGPVDFSALPKNVLKELARQRGLTVGGTRDDLIERLTTS